ncbi:uncharacterized protein KZ484_023434 [Pholidichthys leucotaenia]
MEGAGAALVLLFSLLWTVSSAGFYGDSISFMPPECKADGTYKVTFFHRQNAKGQCENDSSLTCESGVCTTFDKTAVVETDKGSTGEDKWFQAEQQTTISVSTNETSLALSVLCCCWNTTAEGRNNWATHAELDLRTRSDTHAINRCPVTATVSSLRVVSNCFSELLLLAHDPDGDNVRCRFTTSATVPTNFTLDEDTCTLKPTGEIPSGVHLFEVTLEDVPTQNITLTYKDGTSVFREAANMNLPPLCKITLRFSMKVLPSIPECVLGDRRPVFLYKTPSHGAILQATVGQPFQLYVPAQADDASINDFQVSGPQNMTKEFKDDTSGRAEVALKWIPQQDDLHRLVPVCFTAETNYTQSEMRCVVIRVTQAVTKQGKATVQCFPNKMTVTLEKSSMPGIDVNFLKLRDPSCSLTSNSSHITATMSFSTCGTTIEDKGDYIVLTNEIVSFDQPNEVITRREKVKIDFSCQFPKSISISNHYSLHESDYIFTESSFGSFGYTFDIFQDSNFTDKVEPTAYPVEIRLMQLIFMGIQAQSELPNVELFVESCKATPDDNPENSLSYYLVRNGCIEDETFRVHPSDPHSFRFEVQAFKFSGNYDQVYITCSVILCEPESPFSRCAQGCLSDASRRRKRELSRETASHYITQGPLRFVEDDSPNPVKEDKDFVMKNSVVATTVNSSSVSPDTRSTNSENWAVGTLLASNISTVVFASAFLVSVVLLALLVHYYRKKRKAEDRSALIENDI